MSERAEEGVVRVGLGGAEDPHRPSLIERLRARRRKAWWRLKNAPSQARERVAGWVKRVDWSEVVRDLHVYGGLALATWAGHGVVGSWAFVAVGVVIACLGVWGVPR